MSQRTASTDITLRLAHSPDPDDAFMWWPLFELNGQPPRITVDGFRFEPVETDIETLNEQSQQGLYEITAMSCAQYPRVADTYALTACGASMGENYGPKLVARKPMSLDDLRDPAIRIAIPGERTSAFAVLNIMLGRGCFSHEAVDFKSVIDVVADGGFDAGLVIHEGQLTYREAGLHLVADLGEWWMDRFDLPLPLGVNAIRRDLEQHGPGTLERITAVLLASVRYAMDHRSESIDYAMRFARGIEPAQADRFVELYVNNWTLDFGPRGLQAVQTLLDQLTAIGWTPPVGEVDAINSGATATSNAVR